VAQAQQAIASLKLEQVRGNYMIAKYYEKTHRPAGAVVYYNEVLQLDPNSPYASLARTRIAILKPRLPVLN
jgi:outer membrane protein assembly factor BamD (BamD/ComL family)